MSSTDPLHFTHPFPYSEFLFKSNNFLKVEQTNKNIPILLADFLKNLNGLLCAPKFIKDVLNHYTHVKFHERCLRTKTAGKYKNVTENQ